MSFLFKKNAAQDGVPTKFVGICRNGAKYYITATSFEQAKKELTEKAKNEGREVINVRVAEDAAEFKVGDKVKHKAAINGSVYKVIAVGTGFHGEKIYKLSEHKYPYEWYKEHEIVAADSAAMDGAGYANYANARSAFSKALFSATSAAMEVLSAVSGFEKDPQYNKEFEKMVKSDTDFARQFIALKNKFKI